MKGAVLASDASRLTAAGARADRSFLVPRISEDEFVPALLDLCRDQAVSVVIPTIDTELPVLARHRDAFLEVGTEVVISDSQVVDLAADKVLTHQWLVESGLPTVDQWLVTDTAPVPNRLPCIVKPRFGSASAGVAVVHSEAQLVAATQAGGVEFIAQSIASGVEFTIDLLCDGPKCICAVPRQRLEVRGGEVAKGVTRRSPSLLALAERICEALPGAYGPVTVQVFVGVAPHTVSIIEINARFGGGYPLSWQAGADYPGWIIERALGRTPTLDPLQWKDGLVMLRFDDAVFLVAEDVGL